jgi:molybdopterin molybdotransferase
MIEIEEAIRRIVESTRKLPSDEVPLASACRRVLSQNVLSDVDAPPFDKSIMDGFAVRAEDISASAAQLTVVETILAGQSPTRDIRRGEAARIMTGAPMPVGADCVVMIENTVPSEDLASVRINVTGLKPGHHTMKRGTTMMVGQTVLPTGHKIRPHDIGLLAEAGAASVSVFRQPSIAVLATGDELVTASQKPGPSQIRNSNGPMLAEVARHWSGRVVDLGIANDNPESLREKMICWYCRAVSLRDWSILFQKYWQSRGPNPCFIRSISSPANPSGLESTTGRIIGATYLACRETPFQRWSVSSSS